MFEIRVHGLGGQGAVTLVTWVARAGYARGMHVQAFPFFGAERRGAPVKAFVRFSDTDIFVRSQVYDPDLLVVMSRDLVPVALEEGMAPGGRFLVNGGEELAGRLASEYGLDTYCIDATGIAIEEGLEIDGMPMVNLPLFGAVASQSGAASLDIVMDVLSPIAKKTGKFEAYRNAVTRGFEEVALAVHA